MLTFLKNRTLHCSEDSMKHNLNWKRSFALSREIKLNTQSQRSSASALVLPKAISAMSSLSGNAD